MADDVLIRIRADVEAAVAEIGKLRRHYIDFGGDFRDVTAEVTAALDKFSGDKVIRAAQAYVSAIREFGGVQRLTRQEQDEVNRSLTTAVEKMRLLGIEAPAAFTKAIAATQRAREETRQYQSLINNLSGKNVIQLAEDWMRAIQQVGGVQRLTRSEQEAANKALEAAAQKYAALGQVVPENMQKVLASTKQVVEETRQYQNLLANLSGRNAIQVANDWVRAIKTVGGVQKLTRAEQDQANLAVQAAIEKYRVLGQTAPAELVKILTATTRVKEETKQYQSIVANISGKNVTQLAKDWVHAVKDIGGATKLTIAEHKQLQAALQQVIDKAKQLGEKVPSGVRKLYDESVRLTKGVRELDAAFKQISGAKLIAEARTLATAITQFGGAQKLTRAEQKAVNALLTEAAEKYRALGRQVPREITAIINATAAAKKETQGYLSALDQFSGKNIFTQVNDQLRALTAAGGVTKLTSTEQRELNRLLDLAIQKYHALGLQVPKDLQTIYNQTKAVASSTKEFEQALNALSGKGVIAAARGYTDAVKEIGGVTKLTAAEQKDLNHLLDLALQKYRALGQQAPADMQRLFNATRQAEQETTKQGAFFNQFFGRIAGGVTAGTLAANGLLMVIRKLGDAARWAFNELQELITRGGQVQNVQGGFRGLLAGRSDQPPDQFIAEVRAATQGLVSDFKIAEAANRAMLFGLDVTDGKFALLAKSAIQLGKAMNLGPEKALDDLVMAIGRVSPRILDNLGIIVKIGEANQKWADANNVRVKQMTAEQRVLAFEQEALRKIAEQVELLGPLTLNLADRVEVLKIAFTNWRDRLAEAITLSPVLTVLVDEMGKIFADAFGPDKDQLIIEIVKTVEDLTITMVRLGGTAARVVQAVSYSWDWLLLRFENITLAIMKGLMKITEASIAVSEAIPGMSKSADPDREQLKWLQEQTKYLEESSKARKANIDGTSAWAKGLNALANGFEQMVPKLEAARNQEHKLTQTYRANTGLAHARTEEIEQESEATDVLTNQRKNLIKELIRMNALLGGGFDAGLSDTEMFERHGAAVERLVQQARELNIELPEMGENFVRMQAIILDQNIFTAMVRTSKEMLKVEEEWMEQLHDDMVEAADFQIELWKENLDVQVDSIKDFYKIQSRLHKTQVEQEIEAIQDEAQERRNALNKHASNYKEAIDAISLWEIAAIEEAQRADRIRMQELKDEIDTLGEHFREAMVGSVGDSLTQIMDMWAAGDASFSKVGKAVGKTFAANVGSAMIKGVLTSPTVGNAIAQTIAKAFGASAAASVAKLLGELGGVYGALVGMAYEALWDAFTNPTSERAMEYASKQWGMMMSEGLSIEVGKDIERLGNTAAGVYANLGKIIKENGGIDFSNVAFWTQKVHDLFTLLEQGSLSFGDVAKTLDEVFPELVKQIDRFTGLASKDLLELIRLNEEFGTHSIEIQKFLQAETKKAADGFNAVVNGLSATFLKEAEVVEGVVEDVVGSSADMVDALENRAKTLSALIADLAGRATLTEDQRQHLRAYEAELQSVMTQISQFSKATETGVTGTTEAVEAMSQEAFNRLVRLGNVTYQALLSSDKTALEAIGEMAAGLDNINALSEKYGLTIDDTYGDLFTLRQWISEHEQLAGSITGINDLYKGLHNSNQLTQAAFTDMGAVAKDTLDQIVASGLDGDLALQAMQPTLQTMWELQREHKFAVDEGTQAMLDQAEASGLIGLPFLSAEKRLAENTDKMATGIEKLDTTINRLIEELKRMREETPEKWTPELEEFLARLEAGIVSAILFTHIMGAKTPTEAAEYTGKVAYYRDGVTGDTDALNQLLKRQREWDTAQALLSDPAQAGQFSSIISAMSSFGDSGALVNAPTSGGTAPIYIEATYSPQVQVDAPISGSTLDAEAVRKTIAPELLDLINYNEDDNFTKFTTALSTGVARVRLRP